MVLNDLTYLSRVFRNQPARRRHASMRACQKRLEGIQQSKYEHRLWNSTPSPILDGLKEKHIMVSPSRAFMLTLSSRGFIPKSKTLGPSADRFIKPSWCSFHDELVLSCFITFASMLKRTNYSYRGPCGSIKRVDRHSLWKNRNETTIIRKSGMSAFSK